MCSQQKVVEMYEINNLFINKKNEKRESFWSL